MSIHDALSSKTLRWRAVRGARPGYDLTDGTETWAIARAGEVEIGERLLRTEAHKGGLTSLVDVSNGATVASIRQMAHGPAAINAASGRYRMSKQGVLPFALEVTQDFGGPQILEILHLGPLIRVRAGEQIDVAPAAEVELVAVLSGMAVLGLVAPSHAVAA